MQTFPHAGRCGGTSEKDPPPLERGRVKSGALNRGERLFPFKYYNKFESFVYTARSGKGLPSLHGCLVMLKYFNISKDT